MSISWIIVAVVLAILLMLPGYWGWRMVWLYLFETDRPAAPGGRLPRALVILPIRGADPSLKSCLTGLLQQDYPDYSVRVIIDSPGDPGWESIRAVLAANAAAREKIKVEIVSHRWHSCSAKVSAQLQALSQLDARVEVVAFIDADSIPTPDWLRVLVAPLADHRIGASSGVRWFVPADTKWGSWVRHSYNAGSFTQMRVFHIPWGGSMAMRAEVIRRSGILDHWSRCFCEDTSTYNVLRKLGLRVAFVPQATQFNQESIDLKGAYAFILRQLLCVRLHHLHWPVIVAANLGNTFALGACAGLLTMNVLAGTWTEAALWAGLLAVHGIVTTSALFFGDHLIRSMGRRRGSVASASPLTWRQLPAALLAQMVACHCIIWAHFLRAIRWRGITYAITGRDKIRLLHYASDGSWASHPGQSVL